MKAQLLSLPIICLLFGCQANPYAQSFKPTPFPGGEPPAAAYSGTSKIIPVPQASLVSETKNYEKHGYFVVGYSIFTREADDYSAALASKAKEVQADIVLTSTQFAGMKRELLSVSPSSGLRDGLSNSGGYVNESGGRFATNQQSSPSMMTNSAPTTLSSNTIEMHYSAVFLRKVSPQPVTPTN
jgi:hypothetical protein